MAGLLVWLAACAVDDPDPGDGGASVDPNGVNCFAIETEEECVAATSMHDDEACVWFPHYVLTTEDGTVCSFEPAGGSCTEPFDGDTSCGLHLAECGVGVAGEQTEDGTVISRTDTPCETAPLLPQVICSDVGPDDPEAALCSCACSPDYPE